SYFVHTAPVAREIKRGRLDDPEFLAELDGVMSRAGTNLARDGGRLAESGGRDALAFAREEDPDVIGYYRKTDDDPCGFCAMVATRGLAYSEFSDGGSARRRFVLAEQERAERDGRDAREFTPDQYHPDCHCQTLPLFRGQRLPAEDEQKRRVWSARWKNTPGTGETQLKNFRESFDADRRTRSDTRA
ncbi:VG15 protein, partial [Streptomyces katsurahamanus]